MDKFTKMFEADMQNSLDNLEEGVPDFLKKAKDKVKDKGSFLGRRAKEEATVAGNKAKFALGQAKDKVSGAASKVGKAGKELGQDTSRAARAIGGAPGDFASKRRLKFTRGAAAKEAVSNLAKKAPKRGLGVLGAGGLALAGGGAYGTHKIRNRKRISESVLEEVKGRIAARKIEEGIGAGAAFALGSAKAGLGRKAVALKGFGKKVFDQTKTFGENLGYAGKSTAGRYKTLRNNPNVEVGIKDAVKNTAGDVGKYVGRSAKANPWGAGVIGTGVVGAGGGTAYGLKKKKVQ